MAYLYKGLAQPEAGNSAVLLGWHEKVSVTPDSWSPVCCIRAPFALGRCSRNFPTSPAPACRSKLTEAAGTGSIVRVLTDRRQL